MAKMIFSTTQRFSLAVKLINDVDNKRFPKLLSRVAEKLHVREEKAFSDAEQKKLQVALGLSHEELSLLLETLEFILQQDKASFGSFANLWRSLNHLRSTDLTDSFRLLIFAYKLFYPAAYHGMKANTLQQQLTTVNVSEDKSGAIVNVWSSCGKAIVEKMRKHSMAEKQLESVDWDLNLQLGQASKTKMKKTNAIFHLHLSNNDSDEKEKVLLEFNHQELLDFHNKATSNTDH